MQTNPSAVSGGYKGTTGGGRLGFGNPTEENQNHVNAFLATDYLAEKRLSAVSPYFAIGDKEEANVRPNEIAFQERGMRNMGATMMVDGVMISTSLNGFGEDEATMLKGFPDWLIEEAIMDNILPLGVTWSEADFVPNKFGTTANKAVALVTAGKATLPCYYNVSPGDLIMAAPHEFEEDEGLPNGIPKTKVILVGKPYDPEQRDFSTVFLKHAKLRYLNHELYQQVFSRMHSVRGQEREAAWHAIEESILTIMALGAYMANKDGLSVQQMVNAFALNTTDESTDLDARAKALRMAFLEPEDVFGAAAVGGDGDDNPNVDEASGEINMETADGRLLQSQVNALPMLAGGVSSFHRIEQQRILGTADTGGSEGGVFDINLRG